MAALVRKPNPDSIVALIIAAIIVWCISTCNTGCSFKGNPIYVEAQGLLIRIEKYERYQSEPVYYLIYDYRGIEVTVETLQPNKRTIGHYYPITPNR